MHSSRYNPDNPNSKKKETLSPKNPKNQTPKSPKKSPNNQKQTLDNLPGQPIYRNLSTIVQYDIDDINSRSHDMTIPETSSKSKLQTNNKSNANTNPRSRTNSNDKQQSKQTDNNLSPLQSRTSHLPQQNPPSSNHELVNNQPKNNPRNESPRSVRSPRYRVNFDPPQEQKPKVKKANKIPEFYSEVLLFKDKNHIRINPHQSKDMLFEEYIISLKD